MRRDLAIVAALLAVVGVVCWWAWSEPAPDGSAAQGGAEQRPAAEPARGEVGSPAAGAPANAEPAARSPVGPVRGSVVGPDGQIVVGASVTLSKLRSAWPERASDVVEKTATDAEGRFTFGTPRGEDLLVQVEHPELSRQVLVAPPAVESLMIRMRYGFEVTGFVLGPLGQRMSDCFVTLEPGPWGGEPAQWTTTDSSGQFRFSNVDAGTSSSARLTARFKNLFPASLPAISIGSGEPSILQFMRVGAFVEGRVVQTGTRRPIVDAEVRAFPSTSWNGGLYVPYETTTNHDGRFRLIGLGTGNTRVVVRHADHSTAATIVNLSRQIAPLTIEMIGRSQVQGRLFGEHVAGLELVLTTQALEIGRTVVDRSGRFAFPATYSAGAATLEIADGAGSFLRSSGRAVFVNVEEAATTVLDLEVGPPSHLTGAVVDPDGRPLPGVEVSTARHRFAPRNPERLVTVTDADGSYRFDGLPAGSTDLLFEHPSYATVERTQDTPSPGETARAETVTMLPPGAVRGRVLRSGSPMPGVIVFAARGRNNSAVAVTGPDGRYELGSLVPGQYRVMARYSTLPVAVSKELAIVQSGGSAESIDLEFPSGRQIRGAVFDPEGIAIENAMIVLSGRTGAFASTDSSGTFAMEVPAGDAELQVFSPDFQINVREVVGESAQTISVRMPLVSRGSVSARVLGLPSRRPVPIGVVRIRAIDPESSTWDENTRRQRSPRPQWVAMPSGRLQLDTFPTGRAELVLHCPGFGPFVKEVDVDRRVRLDLGTILLEPGATVRGVVTGDDGAPVPGAIVHVGEEEDLFGDGARLQFLTDPAGRFEIGGITPDATQLVVFSEGCSMRTVALRLPEDLLRSDPLPVRLSACSTIEVQLQDAGSDLQDLRLIALFRDGDLLRVDASEHDGRLRFETPTSGRYSVVPFGQELSSAVTVEIGAEPQVHRVTIDVRGAPR